MQSLKTSSNDREIPFYIDKKILASMRKHQEIVKKRDQDRVRIIDGREGTGKSTLALQQAYVDDPNFCLNNVVFTSNDFENRIRNAPKHSAIVFDEAFNGLSSKGALSGENKRLVKLLMECRQQGHFIYIVLPSLFLLEKYVAIFRSNALYHVCITKDGNQRFYRVYNYDNKKLLYLMGKANLNYSRPKIVQSFKFYRKLPPTIDPEEYRKKKLAAFKDEDKKEKPRHQRWVNQRNVLLRELNKVHGIPLKKIEELFMKNGCDLSFQNIGKAIQGEIQ